MSRNAAHKNNAFNNNNMSLKMLVLYLATCTLIIDHENNNKIETLKTALQKKL